VDNIADIDNWILVGRMFIKLVEIWWPLMICTVVTFAWIHRRENRDSQSFSGWV